MASSHGIHRQRERADSFGAAARAYDQYRPHYPAQLIDDLVAPGIDTALDVGAGTGISSRQLADRRVDVLALEPDPRMAEIAAEKGIRTQLAKFEDWDAAGQTFDLVLFAQSFHWVDPDVALPKVRRLLSERGRLALAWNRLFPVLPSRDDFAPIYRDYMDPGAPQATPAPSGGHGPGWTSVGSTTCSRMRDSPSTNATTTARRTSTAISGSVWSSRTPTIWCCPRERRASCATAWQSASVPAVSRWATTRC